jgi:ribosomal protein S18 acetylase RimI-like enzyme
MEKFTITILEESQFKAIRYLLDEDYLQRERCCVTSGFSATLVETGLQLSDESTNEILQELQEGFTLVAVDNEDHGKIAGVAINIKAKDKDDSDLTKFPRSRQAIVKFVKKLKEGHDITKESNGQGLHIWMLCVRQVHCGKGLARKLIEKSIEMAQQHSMAFIDSVATSPETVHLFEDMGFETKSEIKFQDFLMDDGTPGFPGATASDKARFVVKKL